MEGVKHYKRDGTEFKGNTHKMADGTLHSGKTHTKGSVKLFHLKDLSATAKKKAKRQQIMAKTVFDVLTDKLTDHKRSSEEFIRSGAAKDFASYKEVCGVLRGLDHALREINDLSRNYMEETDD